MDCTPEDIEAIRRAAFLRAQHMNLLADGLDEAYRELTAYGYRYPLLLESAAQFRQLAGKETP